MWQNEDKLIRRVFLGSLGAFFLSMLTASLGSLVDGLVIGNTMDTESVAAFQIINPLNFAFAIIGSVLNSGSTNSCARALGRNESDKARGIFSVTNLFGLGISILVALLIFIFVDPIIAGLGAEPDTSVFSAAKGYLIAYIIGLPAITGTKLLSSIMHLDGDRHRIVVSTAVMTVVNIAGDLICVFVFHTGLAPIALVTSISYYSGLIVLLLHFTKKDIIFRFTFKNLDYKSIGKICINGMPKGFSRVTSTIRGMFLNKTASLIAASCIAGFAVSSNINYLINAVVMGIASTFMILTSVYHGEKNKKALSRTVRTACFYEILLTGTICVALFIFADKISGLYLGKNADAIPYGASCIRWYAAGLLPMGFNILFADYLQCTDRVWHSNIIYAVQDVVLTIVFVLAAKPVLGARGLYAAVALSQIATCILIPVFIMCFNKRFIRRADDLLMIDIDYGIAPEDEYSTTITDIAGVIEASKGLIKFCLDKGLSEKTANALGLAAEEMASNIIQNGFTDGKEHFIDLRALYKPGSDMTLILRDDCKQFDPVKMYKKVYKTDSITCIGIRLTMNIAKDVKYTSTLKLNNLTIKV